MAKTKESPPGGLQPALGCTIPAERGRSPTHPGTNSFFSHIPMHCDIMSPRGWPRLKKTTPEEDTMDEIIAKLDEFIRERCDVGDDPEYDLDVNLFDTGFMDSMGAVETITFAEQTFGVEISQKDITLYPMNTVNEIAAVIGRKKGLC